MSTHSAAPHAETLAEQSAPPAAVMPEAAEQAARVPIAAPPEAAIAAAAEQVAAADTAITEERPPLKAPESLVPQPMPPVKNPVQVAGALAPTDALVLDEHIMQAAEKSLAAYVGQHISPSLTNGLVLTLKEFPNHGHAGLELAFQGPQLTANKALLEAQVKTALGAHPVFGPLLANHEHAPHAVEKDDAVALQIGKLTVAQYHTLVQQLATQHVAVPIRTSADLAASAAGIVEHASVAVANDNSPQLTIEAPAAASEKLQAKAAEVSF